MAVRSITKRNKDSLYGGNLITNKGPLNIIKRKKYINTSNKPPWTF